MKTTIELPDQLFLDAKTAAAKRRTTLKALFTHALEREIYADEPMEEQAYGVYEDGLPYLPASDMCVDTHTVNELLDEDVEY